MLGVCLPFSAACMLSVLVPSSVLAAEVMTDRCSAEVAIVPSYDARPETPSTIVLKRGSNGSAPWTPPFTVKLGDAGHIRWVVSLDNRQHV